MDWKFYAAIVGMIVSIGILVLSRKRPIYFGFGVWGFASAIGLLMEEAYRLGWLR